MAEGLVDNQVELGTCTLDRKGSWDKLLTGKQAEASIRTFGTEDSLYVWDDTVDTFLVGIFPMVRVLFY